jgi:hypothetical protein
MVVMLRNKKIRYSGDMKDRKNNEREEQLRIYTDIDYENNEIQ